MSFNIYRNKFRVLVPGGGTRGAYFMSEQLNHTRNSEIVYIDFSKSSMVVAQLMNSIRKTSNVVWIISWIEAIPYLGLGNFEFVTCTGVLHHLKSPQKGLNIVKDTQSINGGAFLMVYGKHGRIGIYQLQHLFRILNNNEKNISKEISNAKKILHKLSKNPWLSSKDKATNEGDIETYDLLLHKRDVAFSISSLYEWVEKSNYRSITFALPSSRASLTLEVKIPDDHLQNVIKKLSIRDQYWTLDILCGHIRMHELYVSLNENAEAHLFAKSMKIYLYGSSVKFLDMLTDKRFHWSIDNHTYVYRGVIKTYVEESGLSSRSAYKVKDTTIDFIYPITEFSQFVIAKLAVLRTKPIFVQKLINQFKLKTNFVTTDKDIKIELQTIIDYLRRTGMIFLKHKSVGPFPKTCCYNKFKVVGVNKHQVVIK